MDGNTETLFEFDPLDAVEDDDIDIDDIEIDRARYPRTMIDVDEKGGVVAFLPPEITEDSSSHDPAPMALYTAADDVGWGGTEFHQWKGRLDDVAISPHGQRMALQARASSESSPQVVFFERTEPDDTRQVISHPSFSPAWSSDGRWLTFAAEVDDDRDDGDDDESFRGLFGHGVGGGDVVLVTEPDRMVLTLSRGG